MFSPILPGIQSIADEMITLRRQLHAHPELGFEEFNTSRLVREKLQAWGYEVQHGIGGTGVVASLHCGKGPSIGLRADMDALPIQEESGRAWASQVAGKMHACGHDGHTAILLAAACELARRRSFAGTLHLFFQPAEEGHGGSGAKRMLDEGLFQRFPCDAIFALHNMPGMPLGSFGFRAGPFMASTDTITIRLHGTGGHGAMPQSAVDPVVTASALVMALQTIVSRNVSPLDVAVVTVGALLAGDAANVIPASAELRLTVRALKPDIRELLHLRIRQLAEQHAAAYGATAEITFEHGYPVLFNDDVITRQASLLAREYLGAANVQEDIPPLTGSEDFAYWLEQVPGCYFIVGNGDEEGGCMVHNPGYDFNDNALPLAASYWVRLVEYWLAPEHPPAAVAG
ncbi:N-acyl-L-amino acid amidohydrolase [Aquitalea magnusonii]|uniref:N-acyl-L-amino acid amidohydrolase n=1 Tax=Aquitalea magnusonii TaxID=332411 RepID=A0A3G9GNU8_9NEIS|nr:M20 aminoacylase family protein [Aquitalea magnusonii]BBF87352.1 N-acyl-L-amino acid amidohydrolase [Aquitalea magnusonii]